MLLNTDNQIMRGVHGVTQATLQLWRAQREILALALWADTSDEPFASQNPERQDEYRLKAQNIMAGRSKAQKDGDN